MKALILITILAAVCVTGGGCEKPEPVETPGPYDKAVDGAAPVSFIEYDPAILTDTPSPAAGGRPLRFGVEPTAPPEATD